MSKQTNWEDEFDRRFGEEFYDLHYRFCPIIPDEKQEVCRTQKDDLMKELKSFISQTIKQERQKIIDDIDDMLVSSLPKDAENLSLLTPDQAQKVVKGFLKKLQKIEI